MDNKTPFSSHLEDLRSALLKAVSFMALGILASWFFVEPLLDFLRQPILPHLAQKALIFTAPMDKFMAHIKVALFSGFVFSFPFWFYCLWSFAAPGLHKKERLYVLKFTFYSSLLFSIGMAFTYFIVFPLCFQFLLQFGGSQDLPMITLPEYLSFFIKISLAFGLCFQMPLLFFILKKLNLITSEKLKNFRRYAVVILAALSALVTPPDIASMFLLFIPLFLLYEISIFLLSLDSKSES